MADPEEVDINAMGTRATSTLLGGRPPRGLATAGLLAALAVAAGLAPRLEATPAAPDAAGPEIYRQRCASCHGASGEGVAGKHDEPLAGDRSVSQLARYIERKMPEDEPEKCVGEEALAVARYIHDEFYSPIARARHRPARVDLSRLTIRQHQNALADLVGSFRPPNAWSGERGLRGEYFDAREPRGRTLLARTDARVEFRFGPSSAGLESVATKGFAARWSGSLIAPETGEYEVNIRTDRAARLWLNDARSPLIDAWVKSGDDLDHRATILLLGGRLYPLQLEFTARKQGVDDSDKKKADDKPVESSLALLWRLPGRAPEAIPERCLTPRGSPEVFVVPTRFPPDDRSQGFERGTSISREWDEAASDAAIETATYVLEHLEELSGARKGDAGRESKLRRLCERFVERAFRRPLGEEERRLYVEHQLQKAPDIEAAVARCVILTLKSPRFLYLDIEGSAPGSVGPGSVGPGSVGPGSARSGATAPDTYSVASRLSFALWDSLPDQRLLDAAAGGWLGWRDGALLEARRMVADLRAHAKASQFIHEWLGVGGTPELVKDAARFPEFGLEVATDLRTSLDLFLDDVLWGESGDFRQLLLSSDLYLNGRLGPLYGADLPPDAPFERVRPRGTERAGVLSHPYLMARYAYPDNSSPIHRGVFLVRSVLGRALRPPPEAFAPLSPALHPDLTTRERITLQTEQKPCSGCHEMINPLGFAFEHFDAVGRFRADERGKPIDASGLYEPPVGEPRTFVGARQLAEVLAASEEVYRAFATQLFHHLVKQPILAFGPETPATLGRIFEGSHYNVRELMAQIAALAALRGLPETVAREPLRDF